jgi:hypothetical protein
MKSRIKQYLLIALVVAAGYFIMNNHLIFDGKKVYLLEKTSLHLHYTFFSINQKKPDTIMKVDELRDAGIGELLVELGKMSSEDKYRLESKYGSEY